MRFTVFTPTYNRGYIITQLYESLKNQTLKDFEWLVVDDGSNDNTEQLFQNWMGEACSIKIRYEKVQNGGKHRAINIGTEKAKGEMFLIVDSDDFLEDTALEKIDKLERTIEKEEKKQFAGVKFLRNDLNGNYIGKPFPCVTYCDITYIQEQKHEITGDKFEIVYTEVMKKYQFPEFSGENFLTEDVVWNRIAHEGLFFRCCNDSIYYCEYREDGLTASRKSLYYENPKGYGLYLHEVIQFGIIKGINKVWAFYRFYNTHKSQMNRKEIAECLQWSMVGLELRKSIYDMIIIYRRIKKKATRGKDKLIRMSKHFSQ